MTKEEIINGLEFTAGMFSLDPNIGEQYKITIDACKDAIALLKQEPKTGHWIRVDKTKVKCSECEITHFIAQYPNGKIDWCPNCGAKMIKLPESEDKKCHKNS